MEPSTSEFQIAMAELLASLTRRMGVLHAAAHAAGLLHTPPPRLPDRVADHVRYYKGLFTKYPQLGPQIEDLLERYQQAGKDLARVEAEAEDAAWVPVSDLHHVLAYPNERRLAEAALDVLSAQA